MKEIFKYIIIFMNVAGVIGCLKLSFKEHTNRNSRLGFMILIIFLILNILAIVY